MLFFYGKSLSSQMFYDKIGFYLSRANFLNVEPKTLMLLVANLANYKMMQKNWKMTETLANGLSSESTRRDVFNIFQHDRV